MKIADGELRQILAYDLKISPQMVRELAADSKQTGRSLLQTVQQSKQIDEVDLAKAQGKRIGVPFVDLAEITIPSATLHRLPHQIAAKYHVVCFEETPTSLKVAMADPRDEHARKALKDYSGKTIRRYQATSRDLTAAMRGYRKHAAPIHLSTRELLTTLLEQAERSGAHDLHFELHDNDLLIKHRIGKRLQVMSTLPANKFRALISWCRAATNNDVGETDKPQHGRFSVALDGVKHDVMLSIMPAVGGEKMVLRLIPPAQSIPSLKALGYGAKPAEVIDQLIKDGRGLIVVAGDKAAGVSTTLASLTKRAGRQVHSSVTSIEEPLMYHIPSVTQVEVTHALPFSDIVGAVIAQNPNIMMTSQLGKSEAAEQLIDFALSQHLVISGLHTSSMVSALHRLMSYPLAPALMAASLRLLIVQHQLERLCTTCRVSFSPAGPLKKVLYDQFSFSDKAHLFRRGPGCQDCRKGHRGQVPVIEWLPMSSELQQLMATKADRLTIASYVTSHSNLAKELGVLASKGIISIDAAADRLALDR